MENSTTSRLKHALGFLTTVATYTLHVPHFAYAEYKRNHFQKSAFFHEKILHHLEVINMNADSTYNYIHSLSFATSKGDNETYYFHQAMQQNDREDCIDAMIKKLTTTQATIIGKS